MPSYRCKHCPMIFGEQPIVRGSGPLGAKYCVVGERAGRVETVTGKPFTGPAGELLNRVLREIEVDPNSIFRTNVVRCYAPNNKPPRASETQACASKMAMELGKLKDLKMVIALGAVATKTLLDTKKGVTWLRGRTLEFPGMPCKLGITYHPAAVLRNPDLYSDLKEDLDRYFNGAKRSKIEQNYYWARTEKEAVTVLRFLLGEVGDFEEDVEA